MEFPVPEPAELILERGSIFETSYEVLDELGTGSFGRVYRARQLSTGQLVAVKVLRAPSDSGARAKAVERFRREMRICAELSHPNIVRLIDSGESANGDPYAVFEHVPGGTLGEALAREGALEPREALRVMGQVLDALAAAHAAGIVHRDLKPANVMLSGTGARRNALVLDFGLGGIAEDARRREWAALTGSREFMGTPFYAAPEQLKGAAPTTRSDLYSWGVMLLECLLGRHPLDTGDAEAPLGAEIEIPAWLGPHPLGQLVEVAVVREPERRETSAETLLRRLDAIDLRELPRAPSASGAPTTSGEQRPVAIVSCHLDLRAAERVPLGIEERDAILREVHALCAEVARRTGGEIASKLGDRVVLAYGYPVAHEDDASRAARAALDLAQQVRRRSQTLEAERGATLDAKIGVHSGMAIVRGSRTSGASLDLTGETTELAQSLDGLASPGQVLASEALRSLLRDEITAEAVPDAQLGESAAPIYRLGEGAGAAPASDTPLVGREAELDALLEAWRRAASGTPEQRLLQGDAGIGKSRLVRELRRRARPERWLECRCLPENRDAPLRPLIDLLSSSVETVRPLLEAVSDRERGFLGALLDPGVDAPLGVSRERQKDLTLGAIVSLLCALGERQPVVFVVEDLHWADPTTIELLGRLTQELAGARAAAAGRGPRILALYTARPDFAPTWPDAASGVLALPRLGRAEVASMIAAGLGDAPALPASLVERVVSRADGVPLFVEEVTRVLAERHPIDEPGALDSVEIPRSLRSLLVARLDALSAGAAETARLASTLGREFRSDLLRAVSPRPETALLRDLDELLRAGLVFPRRQAGHEGFVFKHGLVRDAAYESMLPSARRAWHARIADAYASQFADVATQRPELLALHLAAAGRAREAAQAWQRAGALSMRRCAYAEAESQYRNALDLLEQIDASPDRTQWELELTESYGTAQLSTRGYASPEVERTFAHARALCETLGEGVPLPVLWGTWGVQIVRSSPEGTEELAGHLLRHAEKTRDPLALLTAHTALGIRAYSEGDFAGALAETEQALQWYESAEARGFADEYGYDVGMYAHAHRMVSLSCLGYPMQALAVRDELMHIAEAAGNPYSLAIAQAYSMNLVQEVGAFDEALALADRQISLATEQHFFGYLGPANCTRGVVLSRMGRHAEGVPQLELGLGLCRATGLINTFPYLLALHAEAKILAGDLDGGLASVEEGLGLVATILDRAHETDLLRLKGELLRLRGDDSAAELPLRQALAISRERGSRSYELRAAMGLARLLSGRGERREAHDLVQAAYDAFSEGFDVRDLRSARAMLAELQ